MLTLAAQVTTIFFVYPSLLLIYFGEAAYLATFPADFARSYFAAIPQALFWPMFLIATASALVGSQSLISSAFSVARQSAVMSCFPPVRVRPSSGHCPLCRCLSPLSGPVWLAAMAGLAYPTIYVMTILVVCLSLSSHGTAWDKWLYIIGLLLWHCRWCTPASMWRGRSTCLRSIGACACWALLPLLASGIQCRLAMLSVSLQQALLFYCLYQFSQTGIYK